MPIQTPKEIADGPRSNIISLPITLCLDVNAVKTKRILINNTIDAIITRASGPRSRPIRRSPC